MGLDPRTRWNVTLQIMNMLSGFCAGVIVGVVVSRSSTPTWARLLIFLGLAALIPLTAWAITTVVSRMMERRL